eukprot:scaffold186430_cov37-Attheya_sp.AAC.1
MQLTPHSPNSEQTPRTPLLLSACLWLLFPSFVLELLFAIDTVINLMGGGEGVSAVLDARAWGL